MNRLLVFGLSALVILCSFKTRKKTKLKLPEEFAYIPQGTIHMGCTDDVISEKRAEIVSFNSFYLSRYEVTNDKYRKFYYEVSPSLGEMERSILACDSTGWDRQLNNAKPLTTYYYSHPAYNEYPVVNVSHEGALKYCEWLQNKLQANNPDYIITVSLPTRNQWTYAAMGGRSQAMFPWGNYYLRNRKGEFLCNFKRVGDEAITRNRETNKPQVSETNGFAGGLSDALYTANVKTFYPNDYGLYNMSGNVAEMVLEKSVCMGGSWNDYGGDVTTRSEAVYVEPAPTVGFRPMITVAEKKN